MDLVRLMKSLSEASGVSGYEDEVRGVVRAAMEPYCDEMRQDAMGNLIGLRRGTQKDKTDRRRVMLAGHMDEIGLIVTSFEDGFIRFTQAGGYDVRILPGQRVTLCGKSPMLGVIGCLPPHVEDEKTAQPMEQLFIDVGLSAAELEKQVRVGDAATLYGPCISLGDNLLVGKAFDDRAGVAAVLYGLHELSKMQHEWDVYAVATVQEEIGLRGAFTSTFGVAPDLGVATDVGFGKQPGVPEERQDELDKGPNLVMGPNIHPAWLQHFKDTAKKYEVPIQSGICARGTGTDANAMQITRAGIPTVLVQLPIRNMHTPIETLHVNDLRRAGRLMALAIADMDLNFMDKICWPSAAYKGDAQ